MQAYTQRCEALLGVSPKRHRTIRGELFWKQGNITNLTRQLPYIDVCADKCMLSFQGAMAEFECSVCFGKFDETGPHIPRILPCSHTLCEACIENSKATRYSVKCPECRDISYKSSYPQNRYIVTHLKDKDLLDGSLLRIRSLKTENEKLVKENKKWQSKLCSCHGKLVNLYCEEPDCQQPICSVCLSRDHKCHHVVDLQEKTAENHERLLKNIDQWKEEFKHAKDEVQNLKELLKTRKDACIEDLETKRDMIVKHFDELISQVTDTHTIAFFCLRELLKFSSDFLKDVTRYQETGKNSEDLEFQHVQDKTV